MNLVTTFMDSEDALQSAGMYLDLANGYDKLPECENGYLHVDENMDTNMDFEDASQSTNQLADGYDKLPKC
ncbi:11964_t:CDS:2 [Gigaspora rosea]|nr:11964_t:CDS:2 [Gigaspora rosea]